MDSVVLREFSVVLCVIKHIITLSCTEDAQSCTEKISTIDSHLLSAFIHFIYEIHILFFSDILFVQLFN